MISQKNLAELNLTEEQLQKYKELERKERALTTELQKCKVHRSAIPKIIQSSDLNKVDLENLEALDEAIRNEWKEFIFD